MPQPFPIDNTEPEIDSLQIIERIETLEAERRELTETVTDLKEWEETEGKELNALRELADDAEPDSEEWTYGARLVRHDCFLQHAKDLADELYSSVDFDDWPFFHIDWNQAAERLKRGYVTVDFDGVTYYIRKTRTGAAA